MEKPGNPLPLYEEINDFLLSIQAGVLSRNPDFFCLKLPENQTDMVSYKAPFIKGFYFLGLVTNAGKTKISFDQTTVADLNSFLVIQSPGAIYSFHRAPEARGYMIYFKKNCLSFFRPELEVEFPFFSTFNTHFFKINLEKFSHFQIHFERVFQAYEQNADGKNREASIQLLALLYRIKEFSQAFQQWQEGFSTPQQLLHQRFIQLVNQHYLKKRTVEDYAGLLHISANHLSQSVKSATGKNASSFISERLISEARSLIRFTQLDMAEIAWQLQFSDPANFGKFFKKHTGLSPMQFRLKNQGN